MSEFQQHAEQGEAYLRASRPDLAIPEYRQALALSPDGASKMYLSNTLARVLDLQGEREEASGQFRQTLEIPHDGEAPALQQQAVALNNLGRLSLPHDPVRAVEYFDQAIDIFGELSGSSPDFTTHLAHSHMARGEAYYLDKKYWFAKKDYKAAIGLRKQYGEALGDEMRALAHYQLGAIYSDEFNGHDARTHYQRALDLYTSAMESDPGKYRPLVAACLNNLAVTLMQMEEYDKAIARYRETLRQYKLLCEDRPEVFRPYLASTYANTGVLLADRMKKHEEAIEANAQAMALYRDLAETHPERYTHYLATAYHNAGIYTLETPSWPGAAPYLSRALALRRELDEKEPGAFGADFCATALNLLEFYQRKLEDEKDIAFKGHGLSLLEETAAYLEGLSETPATENMKGDFRYFQEYFEGVDEEEVRTLDILQKIRAWDLEIDSTLEVDEKSGYQDRILEAFRGFFQDYPDNKVLLKPYTVALNNRAWLHLCKGAVNEARTLLRKAEELGATLPALDCNRAHCDLLEGKTGRAGEGYQALYGQRNASGTDFREVVEKDLLKLESYGVLPLPAADLMASLGLPAKGTPSP